MADATSTLFFDNVTSARIDGDLVKVQLFRLDVEGAPEPAGLVVMTRWAATVMCADIYHTLKRKPDKQSRANVLKFDRAAKQLDGEFSLKGA